MLMYERGTIISQIICLRPNVILLLIRIGNEMFIVLCAYDLYHMCSHFRP